jgi:hypothetical protein
MYRVLLVNGAMIFPISGEELILFSTLSHFQSPLVQGCLITKSQFG